MHPDPRFLPQGLLRDLDEIRQHGVHVHRLPGALVLVGEARQLADDLGDPADFLPDDPQVVLGRLVVPELRGQDAEIVVDDPQGIVGLVDDTPGQEARGGHPLLPNMLNLPVLDQLRVQGQRHQIGQHADELALAQRVLSLGCREAEHEDADGLRLDAQRHRNEAVSAEETDQLLVQDAQPLPLLDTEAVLDALSRQRTYQQARLFPKRDDELADQVAPVLAAHRRSDQTLGLVLEEEHGLRIEEHLEALPGHPQDLPFLRDPQQGFGRALDQRNVPHPLGQIVVLAPVFGGKPKLLRQGRADLDVQGACDLLDLGVRLLADLLEILGLQAEQAGRRALFLVDVSLHNRAQAIGGVHDLHQRGGVEDPLRRIVMIAHRVGKKRLEVPTADQPGSRPAVGQAQGLLGLQQFPAVVGGCLQDAFVLLLEVDPQKDLANVVQEPGQERLVGTGVADLGR